MTATAPPVDAGCPSGLAPPASHGGASGFTPFVRQKNGANALSLIITGAKCGGCLSKIEGAVSALPGVQQGRLNLSTGHMQVIWTGDMKAERIADAISGLGYGVSVHTPDNGRDTRKAEERSLLIAMGVAGFAAANIMLLSVSVWGGHGEMGESTRQTLHAISGLIALPVVVFSGRHFFQSAWRALRHRNVNMDVPISLAIILAFLTSVWETYTGGPHAYFDACIMLLFFLLIGRFLDARLRRQAYAAAHDLAEMQSHAVTRIRPGGVAEMVRASDVLPGDRILLAPGERAVVDMRILEGDGEIDESLVSGESLPRLVSKGAAIFAGSVNVGPALTGEASAAAADSLLSDIANMLETGEQRRAAYRRIADKAVSLYVPFVHITAALAFAGWIIAGASVREAVLVAVCTLIITCPCALALAAPVVQVVASGRLFRSGVFLKSGDALERLARANYVVFDKTGTLTLGAPKLIASPETDPHIEMAAQLARASRHPLSRALVDAAGAGPVAGGVKEHVGLGLEAELDGEMCRLGSALWVGAEEEGGVDGPQLWFSKGDEAPVYFRFEEDMQAGALEAVEALRARGMGLEILSGDQPQAVERMAKRLNIDTWSAEAKPADKAARLERLTEQGHSVLMVGDGMNDAGALALAHASLAPGGAMDISQSASDAVYSGDLKAIPYILQTSQTARSVMLQNFGLAAAYNFIAVPIAVTGHVTPLIAAICMSASSLIVTLNALRMNMGRRL